jgi:hypothetical protein
MEGNTGMKSKRRRVAIVGLAGTHDYAPFDDDAFEIWTLNQGARMFKDKRIDVYFDIHAWARANYRPDYLDDVAALKCLIVDPYTYPYKDVHARYGVFLENSIPMMLYYAGLQDIKDIYLFGLNDFEFTENPRMGLALYHALGALRVEGRRVHLCNQYAMDYSGVYGFTDLQKTTLPHGFEFKERGVT